MGEAGDGPDRIDSEAHTEALLPASHPAAATLQPQTLIDRFVVEGLLGAGGMGVVYGAYDPQLDRRVAVKILRSKSDLLAHEARALGRLSHPNVCAVYDVGTFRDQLFIAMELIDGENLGRRLARGPDGDELLRLFVQAGRGLEAAHAAGVVHADFKPANVLVGNDGRVRVVDFGLARQGERGPVPESAAGRASPLATLGGVIAGTPGYMAPEQQTGQRPTERSDQFSFCVSLWEALYGELPYRGPVEAWRPPVSPAGRAVPARLRRALVRGLEPDPARRWPSMTALLAALEPRTPGRRALVTTGLALMLAGGLAVGLVARARPAGDACAGVAARAGEAWGPARRTAVSRVFLASGAPFAADTFGATAKMLDAYAGAWEERATAACRAGGDASLARSTCLDQRLADLRGLALALESPSPELVRQAPDVAAALEEIASCDAAAGLELPVPQAGALRGQVIALLTRLHTWRSLVLHGALPPDDKVEELVGAAETLGYRPLQAEAQLVRGRVLAVREAFAEAEVALTRALTLAEESRAFATQAQAWKELCKVHGRQHRFAEAHQAARHAEALLHSFGPEADLLRAELDAAEGLTYTQEQKEPEARRLLERALAAIRRAKGPDSWTEASVEGHLAWLLWRISGDLAGAEAHGRHALAIYRAFGSLPLAAADTLDNLGCLVAMQGRPAEALPAFEEALALKARLLPPDVVSVGESEFNYSLTLYHLRRFADAEAHLRRAHGILTEKLHREEEPAVETEALLGVSLALGGRSLAEARPRLEHALAQDAKHPVLDEQERAMARFALALALEAAKADPAASLALARQARTGLAADAHPAPEDLALVEGWLAARGGARRGALR